MQCDLIRQTSDTSLDTSESAKLSLLVGTQLGTACKISEKLGINVIFRGYIDESYNSRMFTLSCLMADPKKWLWFESAWKRCIVAKNKELKQQGRPPISRYHAADCSSLVGEFDGWTPDEQIAFVKSLFRVFARCRLVNVISYSMPVEDFGREFPEAEDVIAECYSELLMFMMLEMADQIEDARKKFGPIREVRIVLFHERGNYDSVLHNAFNKMMSDPTFWGKKYFSTIASVGWENCVSLQPADLWAYENFKESERRLTGRKRRKSLEALLDLGSVGGRSRYFNLEAIRALRKAVEPHIKNACRSQARSAESLSGTGGS